jgi:hypothetical protein
MGVTQVNTNQPFEDGMALAMWLHTEVRPQFKRWGKSGDKRVRLMATVLSKFIEDAYTNQDWAFLGEMHTAWLDASAKAETDGDPQAEPGTE